MKKQSEHEGIKLSCKYEPEKKEIQAWLNIVSFQGRTFLEMFSSSLTWKVDVLNFSWKSTFFLHIFYMGSERVQGYSFKTMENPWTVQP